MNKRIERPFYLKQLRSRAWNGQIKVVTGIRRCGKSFLLNKLYRDELLASGVAAENIRCIALDERRNLALRNPLALADDVERWMDGFSGRRYLFIDEIQLCGEVPNPHDPRGKPVTFYDALNEFLHDDRLDVYVTGSNSRMLSSDILTEFRGRGDEVRVHPLSFAEYWSAVGGDRRDAFPGYARFGGMPFCLFRPDDAAREAYLKGLFAEVYVKDIVERRKIERPDILEKILDFISSSVGSLTNPNNVAGSLAAQGDRVSVHTVSSYLAHIKDAFLFSEARRYDVKGRTYFSYPDKYYCEDLGLRNARLSFRQPEITHLMENAVYNELVRRGHSVDVGVVTAVEKNAKGQSVRVPHEIDFVVNKGGERVYVQSAYAIRSEEKLESERRAFSLAGDSFRKIIVRDDVLHRSFDESGVLHVNLLDFLLDESIV
ncbi:MAG: ATP-binding protein [Kiritimatiellae bacterium]|nr:ATP-binding protein [Kiritimatiellia bacterium]